MLSENDTVPLPPRLATGLLLAGDVAAHYAELEVLYESAEQECADLAARVALLERALRAARLPHAATCPAYHQPTLPCGCRAAGHNAAIDAALADDAPGET